MFGYGDLSETPKTLSPKSGALLHRRSTLVTRKLVMPTTPNRSNNPRRRRVSMPEYEAMLASHRTQPGAHKQAADLAGVSYNTARKAFSKGLGEDMPPIQEVLKQECLEARRILAQDDRQTQLATYELAVQGADDRAEKVKLVRAGQNNAHAALALSETLLQSAEKLVDRIELFDDQTSPRELCDLLSCILSTCRQAADSALTCASLEASALRFADDSSSNAGNTMGLDEAVRALVRGANTLRKLREPADHP